MPKTASLAIPRQNRLYGKLGGRADGAFGRAITSRMHDRLIRESMGGARGMGLEASRDRLQRDFSGAKDLDEGVDKFPNVPTEAPKAPREPELPPWGVN